MNVLFSSRWAVALRCAGFAATLTLFAAADTVAAKALAFDTTFNTKGEPRQLHYRVTFLANNASHQLEVWRDGDRRVKRATDTAIMSFATHKPHEAGYRLVILDLKKKIHTDIDRTNLYRIGSFTDWFDLGHGVRHPKGSYQLALGTAPKSIAKPLQPCLWYDLTQGTRTTHIGWSYTHHIPLQIISAEGKMIWNITALDTKPMPAGTFIIHDKGFIQNNANQDIEGD